MPKKRSKLDASQNAVRVVGETIKRHSERLPADLQAAWEQWSAGVGKVDQRGMVLLRAAFEAGAEAARNRPEIDNSRHKS